jgi:dihydrolipoamide dehydrogenase
LTEKQAKERIRIKIGKFPSQHQKSKASGTSDGFVKVIFDAKYGEWLDMIGAGVTDMIAEAVVA